MKYTYDPLVDALLITLRSGSVSETKEVTPLINIDVDKKGQVLSIEILDAKKQFGPKLSERPVFMMTPYSKKKVAELIAR